MEIIMYDSNMQRQGVIENQMSLIWTRKYFESGDFELHAPLTNQNVRLLNKENIVTKKDSIEAGIIENIVYTDSYDQKKIVASGRFMSSLLDRRLIKQTFSYSGKTEIAMRSLINYVVPIPRLSLGSMKGYDQTVIFQATMKELLSILVKLSKSSGIGFRIIPNFENKTLVFDTYMGVDRSVSQSTNNKVIFSEQFANLDQVEYTWNNQLLKSYAVIGGEGEGSARDYVYIGGGTGLNLREVFVDARDVRSDDFPNRNQYLDALRQRGYEELNKDIEVESFDCITNPNANFVYKKDYDLGDIVTIKKSTWGVSLNLRITEIQEIYENGGMTVVPTLGDTLPDTVEWGD